MACPDPVTGPRAADRDSQSHSLWYTSSRSPVPSAPPDVLPPDATTGHNGSHGPGHHRERGYGIERTALARLAADEQHLQRRRINVQNFGAGWLKPPGVPKTLNQMREEKREQEEHQEALRREQLAQELAEAEAGGMQEEGMMEDVQLDGAQDLDADIPDAGDDFAFGGDDDDDDDDEDDQDDDGDEGEGEDEDEDDAIRAERQNNLMTSSMRMADDAFREALLRGDPDGSDMYGGEEELEEENQGHMVDETDFARLLDPEEGPHDGVLHADMDANLDDDIPEAESGGYEHTDSEAELSSDGDDVLHDVGFAPRAAPMGPPMSPTLRGEGASSASARRSRDLASILSQDESSFMESSPAQGRWARGG